MDSFITPDWVVPEQIKAYSTTRIGGVSNGIYSSLNLASHVGDSADKVCHNRRYLASILELPSEPYWLDQVHGIKVVEARPTSVDFCSSDLVSADASLTYKPSVVCAVMTADCLPLLLTNQAGNQVAAVHVGWRGMASGIIEKVVSTFKCAPCEIIAWAGPNIGPTKFEVGLEVKAQLGGPDTAYYHIKNNKLRANLNALCEYRLAALGVKQFTHSEICTYTEGERFFSYRRDGQCGRMATLIWIEEAA